MCYFAQPLTMFSHVIDFRMVSFLRKNLALFRIWLRNGILTIRALSYVLIRANSDKRVNCDTHVAMDAFLYVTTSDCKLSNHGWKFRCKLLVVLNRHGCRINICVLNIYVMLTAHVSKSLCSLDPTHTRSSVHIMI
jgi:hypothetical protein